MSRRLIIAALVASCCPPEAAKQTTTVKPVSPPVADARDYALPGETHLKNVRQLTFGGDNAEAYWSFSGDRLIFQTNHAPYKCDQIEIMPAAGGATNGGAKLVSTGKGRTTCAYFLKGDKEIIYASTHESSPECPTPPDNSKGYLWGLFEYDIYKANADGSNLVNMTPNTPGYDAEATVCPKDGSIIFTSVRSGDLELWRMDADGKNLRQLTNAPGYDGGAFFSNDCSKIVWRTNRPQGKDLETYKELLAQKLVKPTRMDLWVANADGTEARQITYLAGASFAPFFTPDGKRVLFSTNFVNPRGPDFDIYMINIDGSGLERVTHAPGFDGFPVFSPDGKTLAFSSNRKDVVDGKYSATGTAAGPNDTNVFLADWVEAPAQATAPETASADRFAKNVAFLAADEREGRGIGTKGLREASDFVQQQMQALGAEPGFASGYRQTFDVTTEVKRGAATAIELDGTKVANEEFTPMPFSASKSATAPIVHAGWGIVDAAAKLDDYKGKNVKGKIVLVNRFAPGDKGLSPTDEARLGDIRFKAFLARGKGAVGLIVVDNADPTKDEAPLPAVRLDGMAELISGGGDVGIPVVVVKRSAGAALFTGAHKAKLTVALEPVRTPTDNVVGVIRAGSPNKLPGVLVVGAHIDHLGMGGGSNALDKVIAVHNGADDNASGIAALLEVTAALAARKSELQRDVYLVAFSGEEEGDLGSAHYVKNPATKEPIVAMLNIDMVGRLRNNSLAVNGGDSAKEWRGLVEPLCDKTRLACTIGGSGYGPSDQLPFYIAGAPVLFFFTGNHLDYHTATDDADKINAAGGARIAMLVSEVAVATANRKEKLSYVKSAPQTMGGDLRRVGASLGTIPSYSEDPNQPPGMVLSDVVPDGPAAKAGLKAGDRIVQLGTVEIRSVNDLMFVLQSAKPGTEVKVTFVRDGKQQTATATYGTPKARK
jgi:Tol biopolymer transport system component